MARRPRTDQLTSFFRGLIKLPKRYNVKLNSKIDSYQANSMTVERWRRECLKCEKQFAARGRYVRRCNSCNSSVVDTSNP